MPVYPLFMRQILKMYQMILAYLLFVPQIQKVYQMIQWLRPGAEFGGMENFFADQDF